MEKEIDLTGRLWIGAGVDIWGLPKVALREIAFFAGWGKGD